MDMEMPNDFERLLFFEQARRTAEATYEKNPLDAENLTRWGGVLIELAQFQNGTDANKMIQDGIDKLEEALVIEPKKHDALWCLGNAYTANAFMIPEFDDAKVYFEKAAQCFEQASKLEPQNEIYKKSLELTSKAPELHIEIHKHGLAQQQAAAAAPPDPFASSSTGTKQRGSKKNSKSSDLKYDILGWVILAVGIVSWVGFAKSNLPPPPPPR